MSDVDSFFAELGQVLGDEPAAAESSGNARAAAAVGGSGADILQGIADAKLPGILGVAPPEPVEAPVEAAPVDDPEAVAAVRDAADALREQRSENEQLREFAQAAAWEAQQGQHLSAAVAAYQQGADPQAIADHLMSVSPQAAVKFAAELWHADDPEGANVWGHEAAGRVQAEAQQRNAFQQASALVRQAQEQMKADAAARDRQELVEGLARGFEEKVGPALMADIERAAQIYKLDETHRPDDPQGNFETLHAAGQAVAEADAEAELLNGILRAGFQGNFVDPSVRIEPRYQDEITVRPGVESKEVADAKLVDYFLSPNPFNRAPDPDAVAAVADARKVLGQKPAAEPDFQSPAAKRERAQRLLGMIL